jgi:hypothetical protein
MKLKDYQPEKTSTSTGELGLEKRGQWRNSGPKSEVSKRFQVLMSFRANEKDTKYRWTVVPSCFSLWSLFHHKNNSAASQKNAVRGLLNGLAKHYKKKYQMPSITRSRGVSSNRPCKVAPYPVCVRNLARDRD